jgi:hypothetical protein
MVLEERLEKRFRGYFRGIRKVQQQQSGRRRSI